MSKKITQKIRELLTPEDLKVFESAVENMIQDRVGEQLSSLVQLKEEELTKKYDTVAEEYVSKVISEKLTEEKAQLVESYDSKLSLLEEKIVTKLDSFLDHVISEQISDDMLEKIAINETLAPVVEGIKSVFSSNHLKLDSNANSTIDKLTAEVDSLKEEMSGSIEKGMKLESQLEQSAIYLLISEKTNGLKKSDKQRVIEMFREKSFDDVEKNIDNYLDLIKESTRPSKKKVVVERKKSVQDKVQSVNEGASVKSQKKPVADKSLNEQTIPTLSDYANKYLA